MEAIREILPSLIGDRKVKKSRRRAPIGEGTRPLFPPLLILQPSWEWIVGPLLVNRTAPISLIANRLVVEVPSVAWRVQLVAYEKALLDRIHQLLGDKSIVGIDWKLNPAMHHPPATTNTEPPRKPPQREADPAVREAARGIADEELRELFLRQAARMSR